MGLEKGFLEAADKGGGKIGIVRPCEQGFKESRTRGFHGGKSAKPFFLLCFENLQPAAQLRKGDREAFAELFDRGKAQEILGEDAQDEEQAIAGVWDDQVREDGMGMTAGTDDTEDTKIMSDNGSGRKVNEGPAVVSMDAAGAFLSAGGTGLKLRAETIHEGIKEFF